MASVKPKFGDMYLWSKPGDPYRKDPTVMWVGPTTEDGGWYGAVFCHAEDEVHSGWYPLDQVEPDGYCWTRLDDE